MKKLILFVAAVMIMTPAALFAQKTTITRMNRERTYSTTTRQIDVWYQGELNIGYGMDGTLKWDGESTDGHYGRAFIETVHGARITQYAFVGLGVGLQYALDDEYWGTGFVPVFVALRGYYPVSEKFTPYVSLDLGHSIGVIGTKDYDGVEDLKGGFYAAYGVGLNYGKLNFGLGFQNQSMKFVGEKLKVNSFYVKVGINF